MQKIRIHDLELYQFEHLSQYPAIVHGITTRRGGISTGPYTALNLGFHSGDDHKQVLANRQRLCEEIGIRLDSLVLGKQVHHNTVRIINRSDAGRGALNSNTALADTDALLTQESGLGLMALSADCPLILCYDPTKKVIGTIHASWRGISKGIVPKTIQEMKQHFKTQPKDIRAGIAPSIGPCCYEVKADFIKTMKAYLASAQDFIKERHNKTYFDLWGMAQLELINAGLRPEHIEVAKICTCCHPELFYSYRRDGVETGRFSALIYTKV